ncbi:unnamed protein product [Moneuplotes crassus]|uniref:Alpha/beta hydrolase fold-3 domain-containing protein n=1 Tax=Euplotes crassus TaxID=5936 RepID=A0AAD1YD96_EUPCR|nr:unnamed protein product [Moneuplotes crassus]
MNNHKQVIARIQKDYEEGYSKILNPNRVCFHYTKKELLEFLNCAKDLSKQVLKDIDEITLRQDSLAVKYKARVNQICQSLLRFSQKVEILAVRVGSNHETFEKYLVDNHINDSEENPDKQKLFEHLERQEDQETNGSTMDDNHSIRSSIYSDLRILQTDQEQNETCENIASASAQITIEKCFLSPKSFGNILASIKNIGLHSTAQATEVALKVLLKVDECLKEILHHPTESEYCEMLFRCSFLRNYEDTLHEIVKNSDEDVFYHNYEEELKKLRDVREDSKRTNIQKFLKILTIIYPKCKDNFMNRYGWFRLLGEFGIAIGSKTLKIANAIVKFFKLIWYCILYFLSRKKRRAQYQSFISSNNYGTFWKLAKNEGGLLPRIFFYLASPSIKMHQEIYIPRCFERLDSEGLNQSMNVFVKGLGLKKKHRLLDRKTHHSFLMHHKSRLEVTLTNFSLKEKRNHFKIEIVSPFEVDLDPDQAEDFKEPQECEAILIHIHGGGFVSKPSSQTQVYLREWANEFKMPVFMLSYSLAPEAKYPQAIDELYQQYRWITENIEDSFGLKPKKIFVMGDSAGGKLATSLTALSICKQIRIPDGLLLFYPVLLLRYISYTPSRAHMFDDEIMSQMVRESVFEAYCKQVDADNNPFLSPVLLPKKVLENFPATRINLAGLDPLHDDGYKLGYQLACLGRDVKVRDYRFLPHGYLNFTHVPMLKQESNEAIKDVSDTFRELLIKP